MTSYISRLIATWIPTPEPATPTRPRTLHLAPAKPSPYLVADPPFGTPPTGRLRPAPVQYNHCPSHPNHSSPWQHAWARLTPAEQAWSSSE